MAENNATLFKDHVPAELQEKPYMKEWLDKPWDKDTSAAFFKKHDGIESLLGKRPVVPGKDAKPEELLAHFKGFAPEKPEDYEIPLDEKAPKPDEGFLKAVRAGFHVGNINKAQASAFLAEMQKFGAENQKAAAAAQQKKNQEFDTLAKTMLGEKNKETMARTRLLLKEHAPKIAMENIDKMKDEDLVIMTAVVDAIVQKYMPADDIAKLGKPNSSDGTGGANDVNAKREQMHELMKSKPYKDAFHAEHDSTRKKIAQLAKEIDALGGK